MNLPCSPQKDKNLFFQSYSFKFRFNNHCCNCRKTITKKGSISFFSIISRKTSLYGFTKIPSKSFECKVTLFFLLYCAMTPSKLLIYAFNSANISCFYDKSTYEVLFATDFTISFYDFLLLFLEFTPLRHWVYDIVTLL